MPETSKPNADLFCRVLRTQGLHASDNLCLTDELCQLKRSPVLFVCTNLFDTHLGYWIHYWVKAAMFMKNRYCVGRRAFRVKDPPQYFRSTNTAVYV